MLKSNTKVNTLNLIKNNLSLINIPHYIFFTKKNFEKNKEFYLKKIKNKFKTKFINFQSIKYAKSEKEFELPDIASYDAISNEWRLEDDCEEEIKSLSKFLKYGQKSNFFKTLKKNRIKIQKY